METSTRRDLVDQELFDLDLYHLDKERINVCWRTTDGLTSSEAIHEGAFRILQKSQGTFMTSRWIRSGHRVTMDSKDWRMKSLYTMTNFRMDKLHDSKWTEGLESACTQEEPSWQVQCGRITMTGRITRISLISILTQDIVYSSRCPTGTVLWTECGQYLQAGPLRSAQ